MTDLGLEEKREHKQSKIHFSKALFSASFPGLTSPVFAGSETQFIPVATAR